VTTVRTHMRHLFAKLGAHRISWLNGQAEHEMCRSAAASAAANAGCRCHRSMRT